MGSGNNNNDQKEPRFPAGLAQQRSDSGIWLLTETASLVASDHSLSYKLRTIARRAAWALSARCALVMLYDESREHLQTRGFYGLPPDELPSSLPMSQGSPIEHIITAGGLVSLPRAMAGIEPGDELMERLGVRYLLVSSVGFRGEVFGCIIVGSEDLSSLGPIADTNLQAFSLSAALAIQEQHTNQRLSVYDKQLDQLVEAKTAELTLQAALSEQANQAKSQFVANISHELRAPLTALVGYSKVLAEGGLGQINERQGDALGAVVRSAEHLKDLINDVLDVTRVESGKEEPQPTETPIHSLVNQVVKIMVQSARTKDIKLIGPPVKPDAEMMAWVDNRHLRQMLLNLISNAIKYTPAGGEVNVNIEQVGDKIRIIVSDSGVGIAPEEQDSVFDRYSRSDHSYSRTQKGTGLGLALTKRLADINGGKLGFSSSLGKGSDFWLLIPLAQGLSTIQSEEDLSDSMFAGSSILEGLNILLVDDNQPTLEVMRTIIQTVGATAFLANSIQEAKEIAKSTSLDTALIDLAMPGGSGVELIEFFKSQSDQRLASLPLIVVSACVFDLERQQALEQGAADFIAKPFNPVDLVHIIRELTTNAALGV